MSLRTVACRPVYIHGLIALVVACWMPGCGQKVPTFGELVNGNPAEPTPPAMAPPPVVTPAPAAVPQGPTPAEIIAGFSKIPTFEVTDANLQQLASLPEGKEAIGELKLSGSKVTNEGLAALPNLPNLATLDLSGTVIDDTGLAPLANCPALQELNLSATKITGRGLSDVAKNQNIKKLTITNSSIDLTGFVAIGSMTQLVSLAISQSPLNDEGCQYVGSLVNLEELYMHSCGVSDQGMAQFKRLTKLRVLDIAHCPINGMGLLVLVRAGTLKNLEELGMYACPIGEPGGDALKGLKTLKKVDIGATALRDIDLTIIKPLQNLRVLKCNHCLNLTGEGFVHVKGLKYLEEIYCDNSKTVNDKALIALKGMKQLRVLAIGSTSVTPAAVAQFQRLMPECKVQSGS
jgi:Leucine-rich repeat (LRR) protein